MPKKAPAGAPSADLAPTLRRVVIGAALALRALPDDRSAVQPAPGKWSPREIIGHLVDSASHNHQRFVRAQFQDDLVFPGYAQDEWVARQGYQEADWNDLVTLWESFNLHLARVIDRIPESQRSRSRVRHNLHEIAWKEVPEDQTTTLDYFMWDYLGHLRHHLRQIDAALGAGSVPGLV